MLKYRTEKIPQKISVDKTGVESDCNSIAFTNQGTSTAHIHAGRTPVYRVLEAGKSFTYSNDPDVKEETEFDITFVAGGTNDLLIEREYVKQIDEL